MRSRIIELLPGGFDFYAALLADAKKLGPDKVKLVKTLGREQATILLEGAVFMDLRLLSPDDGSFVEPEHGVESTFFRH